MNSGRAPFLLIHNSQFIIHNWLARRCNSKTHPRPLPTEGGERKSLRMLFFEAVLGGTSFLTTKQEGEGRMVGGSAFLPTKISERTNY